MVEKYVEKKISQEVVYIVLILPAGGLAGV